MNLKENLVTSNKQPTAAMIVIGNEVLSGRTKDKNIGWVAEQLELNGIKLVEARIIRDDQDTIISTIKEIYKLVDYVFTSGGIGPTHDDITAKSISKVFKAKYEYHPEAFAILKKYYGKNNFNDGRKKMSKMPRGSDLIYNPSSAAPGFKIQNVFCLPGVPLILRSMIHNCTKYLKKGSKVYSDSINLITVESNISRELGKLQKKYRKYIDIGSYPFFRLGRVGVSIVLRSQNKHKISLCKTEILKNIVKKKKIKKV